MSFHFIPLISSLAFVVLMKTSIPVATFKPSPRFSESTMQNRRAGTSRGLSTGRQGKFYSFAGASSKRLFESPQDRPFTSK